jgi:hypothetical protein
LPDAKAEKEQEVCGSEVIKGATFISDVCVHW